MTNNCEEFKCESMMVKVFESKVDLGLASAVFVSNKIKEVVDIKGKCRVIFATGASQFEFMSSLTTLTVPWDSVEAFHLDEYVGMSENHPASFRRYLRERLFDKVNPQKVHYLDGNAPDPEKECKRYADLLLEDDIDLACIGIGENGHIAFNDPPVADFNDPKLVKVVELDEACRQQQFGEGWFPTFEDVPKKAFTQTVPAMMRAKVISCVVPDERKAQAVKNALRGPVSTACPASILRTHSSAILWLDRPAASLLNQ